MAVQEAVSGTGPDVLRGPLCGLFPAGSPPSGLKIFEADPVHNVEG